MNIILEECRDIVKNSNTAQDRLNGLLNTISKTTREINISDKLSGEIDFSILSTKGFNSIQSIILSPGKITKIGGFPSSLEKLCCAGNMIILLEQLPQSLKELNCANNHITMLTLENVPNMTSLNCSSNELSQLAFLPETLLKLNCSHNTISKLDLFPCRVITTVDITHNHPNLVIQNRPESLTNLSIDAGVSVEIQHNMGGRIWGGDGDAKSDADESNRDVVDSLNTYFYIKSMYETGNYKNRRSEYDNAISKGMTVKTARKKAMSVQAKCINCRALGGTIFKKKDMKYIALCGNVQKPCNLDIKIFTGVFYDFDEILYEYRIEMEKTKQNIILQKMDTLFNYVSEANSSKLFKVAMEQYNAKSEITKDLVDRFNELHNNLHKQELISRKMDSIYEITDRVKILMDEYKQTGNNEILKVAVDIQIKDLNPEIASLRQLKYEIMEVSISDSGESTLFQKSMNISNMVYSFDEPPKVIRFNRKK